MKQTLNIDIPPGMWRNGTRRQAGMRWFAGNLVRWMNGALRPMKGWVERLALGAGVGTASGLMGYRDNSGDIHIIVGSDQGLFWIDNTDTVNDITPSGWTDGRTQPALISGYGGGPYGSGTYGTVRIGGVAYLPADTWSLDTWGQNLIAVNTGDKRILEWVPGAGAAAALANSPDCDYAFVTEERFVMALGTNGDKRQASWSDRENNTVWSPLATNQAGDFRIPTASVLMAGVRLRGQSLVLTNREAYSVTYIGPPYVYSWQRVGDMCGLVGRRAIAVIPNGAVWMGRGAFFIYQGGSVQPLACDVGDYIFRLIVELNYSLVHAYTNVRHKEVWWFFTLNNGLNTGSYYVAWNYETNVWSMGVMAREAMYDGGLFDNPLGVAGQSLYEHEVGFEYGVSGTVNDAPWAITGVFPLGDGSRHMRVRGVHPDGALGPEPGDPEDYETGELYFITRNSYAGDDQPDDWVTEMYTAGGTRTSLLYDSTVRFAGRELSIQVSNNSRATPDTLADWTFGRLRLDVIPGARR